MAQQAVLTTATINPGGKYTASISTSPTFALLRVTSSGPVRVQLYGTSLARQLDMGRALDVPPSAGTTQGLICDLALDTAPFQWSFQGLVGSNADATRSSSVYATVTNLGSRSGPLTLTLLYVPLETA